MALLSTAHKINQITPFCLQSELIYYKIHTMIMILICLLLSAFLYIIFYFVYLARLVKSAQLTGGETELIVSIRSRLFKLLKIYQIIGSIISVIMSGVIAIITLFGIVFSDDPNHRTLYLIGAFALFTIATYFLSLPGKTKGLLKMGDIKNARLAFILISIPMIPVLIIPFLPFF